MSRSADPTVPDLDSLHKQGAEDIFKIFNRNVANDAAVIMEAFDQLDAYINDMVASRRHNLTDDLISQLIRAEDDGGRLSAAELTMLAEVLLMADTDTTRNQLAAAVQILCDHPKQWALLLSIPSSHRRRSAWHHRASYRDDAGPLGQGRASCVLGTGTTADAVAGCRHAHVL